MKGVEFQKVPDLQVSEILGVQEVSDQLQEQNSWPCNHPLSKTSDLPMLHGEKEV